jgi:uncharacterized protein (PEP-CTERM system associated)
LRAGTLEAVEDWLFVDASATISQQYISAFGAVSPSNANIDRNRTETFYYSLSPYIRGRLLSSAEYLLRYSVSGTNPDSSGGVQHDNEPVARADQWQYALGRAQVVDRPEQHQRQLRRRT